MKIEYIEQEIDYKKLKQFIGYSVEVTYVEDGVKSQSHVTGKGTLMKSKFGAFLCINLQNGMFVNQNRIVKIKIV